MRALTVHATVRRRPKRIGRETRSNGAFTIKTILVPTDLTAASRQAVSVGKALARKTGARLVLLNVVGEAHHWKNFGYGPVDWPSSDNRRLKRSRRKLESLRCHIAEGCIVCTADVESGDPVTEISRVAVGLDADLIIMVTHHLVGSSNEASPSPSVAEAVFRRTRRPVLLLPVPSGRHSREMASK